MPDDVFDAIHAEGPVWCRGDAPAGRLQTAWHSLWCRCAKAIGGMPHGLRVESVYRHMIARELAPYADTIEHWNEQQSWRRLVA